MATQSTAKTGVPRYLLYGEPTRAADFGYVHLESVPSRAALHDWTIQPHAHDELHQVLLVIAGSGTMYAEGRAHPFVSPCLICVPAGTVHGFVFAAGTDGYVLSIADTLFARLAGADRHIATVFQGAAAVVGGSTGRQEGALAEAFDVIGREIVWSAPARHAAIEAALLRILVALVRMGRRAGGPGRIGGASRDEAVVERFRQLLEQTFRLNLAVGAYAAKLGIGEAQLSAACRRVLGASAIKLLHRRVMVEAQRELAYTTASVTEVALSLGFADPAYFSRFFAKHAGMAPSAFRLKHGSRFP